MINAIILAGGHKGLGAGDNKNKALIKIKERYMIDYVIDSLKSSPYVDKVVIVGMPEMREIFKGRVHEILNSEGNIIDNVKKGQEYLSSDKHLLLCTCDIPMVTKESIEDFINRCVKTKADIGYPIIEKSLNEKKYPDAYRTYVKLKDGTYTGGNIIYANPEALKKCYPIAQKLFDSRKNPMKMGKYLGFGILARLILGNLKIETVEKRAQKICGINAKAIISPYPEIGNDVDKTEDVDFVNKYM
ncbi:molybdenum cofactor guanylyltransferase [Oxobacter pfennigii]|uniref:Molybdenum cofactor guanylyltransferase n=1 Tax=Oxobacter pfennigii TaxID=36849 RepID=A0A0P8X191_9CLOT|nr:nucleotidyltransferase family protein [Oxobacter pfennigii]KPU44575.1 molybdenum cofactor guanylyltransferase [Oxobacter pfennigii]